MSQNVLTIDNKFLNLYFQNNIHDPIHFKIVDNLDDATIFTDEKLSREKGFIKHWAWEKGFENTSWIKVDVQLCK
jgi:hypothetical protein